MAANDYYNTSYPPTGQQHSKTDNALPPIPSNQTQHSVSPISSPFDDNTYPPYPSKQQSNTHVSGGQAGYPDTSYSNAYTPPAQYNSHDPFTDQNAIPLQSQTKLDDGSPTRYNSDPERFGPGVEKRRKKKGWFSGRVTWVVYILTVAQIGVFVGELIKNGMFNRWWTSNPICYTILQNLQTIQVF